MSEKRGGPIRLRRVYDDPRGGEGYRVLVDRLWPRGVPKAALRHDEWNKAVAPSTELRRWFRHDPARWVEFSARYRLELDEKLEALEPLLAIARAGPLTLLYAARDTRHTHARVLKSYLEKRLR